MVISSEIGVGRMLSASYAFLVESLYNKMRVMLSEYRAFYPKVTNTVKGKALLEELTKIHLAFISLKNDRQLLKEVMKHDHRFAYQA